MVETASFRWSLRLLVIFLALAAAGCNSNLSFRSDPSEFLVSRHFSPDDDVWDRMRAGMELDIPDNPRVRKFVRWYLDHPATLEVMQENAELYLFHIVDSIDERGLPMELALLPAVESNYTPSATSRSGAAGIWQFIRSTGRVYGLEQNNWYDARRDLLASTDAALDYLAYLHKYFDGDWELAIAAYNGGEGTISRARGSNERSGEDIDFWSLELRQETEDYVPRLMALATLVKYPRRYGMKLAYIPNRPGLVTVETERTVNLADAAEKSGLDKKDFVKINSAYVSAVTTSRPTHRLLVPAHKADTLEKVLAELPEVKPQQFQVATYRVRKGDTISSIARRFGVSQGQIRAQNSLRKDLIQVGQQLTIKGGKATSFRTVAAAPTRRTYKVRKGDTLWSIARSHKVSLNELLQSNGLSKKAVLKPGQTLRIPVVREASTEATRRSVAS